MHRLGGIVCLISSSTEASELADQLRLANVQVLFTCEALYGTSCEALKKIATLPERVVLIDSVASPGIRVPSTVQYLNKLIEHDSAMSFPPSPELSPGLGARLPAFICFSSGTSGKQVDLSSTI